MTKARKPSPPKAAKISYRVVRNSCFHAGTEYKQGDIMPDLPIAALNIHLPNLELVEVEDCVGGCPLPEPDPVEIITQVEEEGGPDYDVLL